MPKKTVQERFWEKVDIKGNNECWEWQSSKDNNGYGWFKFNGKVMRSHRVAWILTYGIDSIPKEMCVLHRCDNPKCCNLAHLYLGTHQDNANDKVKRNRCVPCIGEKNGGVKLTEEQVKEIIRLSKKELGTVIARQFNVTSTLIYGIKNNRTWKHVPRGD